MSLELQIILKTTLTFFGAAVMSLLLKRTSAAVRHAIWLLAVIATLAVPLMTFLVPPLELPVLPGTAPAGSAPAAETQVARESMPPMNVALTPSRPSPPAAVAMKLPIEHWPLQQWLISIWALGAAVVLGGWLYAVWELRRLNRRAADLPDGEWELLLCEVQRKLRVRSRIHLRMAPTLVPPMTWGVFRHVILLPASATTWLAARRRMVLEHEMAHVRRRDGLGQFLSQAVCSLYWFNPLAWYAARRLRAECERACDDVVLSLGIPAADYADHLVDIARGLRSGFARVAISMAQSPLKSRVLAILDDGICRQRLSYRTAGVLLGVTALFTLAVAGVRVTAMPTLTMPSFFEAVYVPAETQSPALPVQLGPIGSGDAFIAGRVVRLGTNEPVRGARVILNTEPISDSPLVAEADDNGRFEFQKVSAGKYRLLATRDGYLRGMFGQRSPGGPGTPLVIAPGQRPDALTLVLTPTGSISGTIRNRFGEPASNVAVHALKVAYQQGGRTLLLVQRTRTNDLGEYRLYYLEPGRYVVSALPPEGPIPMAGTGGQIARLTILPGSAFTGSAAPTTVLTSAAAFTTQGILSPSETGETYVPLYFPGVADLSAATPIEVQPGGTARSTDFIISEVHAVRIRGQVRDAAGQPVKGASVVLVPASDAPAAIDRYGTVKDDGSFEFKGIPPGAYELVASSGNLPAGVPTTAPGGVGGALIDNAEAGTSAATDGRLMARTALRVGITDVENVALTLQPGFAIDGKITFAEVSSEEARSMTAGLAVQLIPGSPLPQENDSNAVTLRRNRSFSMPGIVGPDGTFRIAGAFPGIYRLAIRGASRLPSGSYVQSARIGAIDVLSPRFRLEGEPRGELEIVIGTRSGAVEIAVADEKQAPAKAVTVVLVPDASRRQRYELYLRAVTDAEGRARLENIPPGNYQAYAWETVDDGAWWDSEFLQNFEGQSKSVSIEAGTVRSLELKSIR
jgi:beta-lactamase regulating signal transducer with metallopeptidase domain